MKCDRLGKLILTLVFAIGVTSGQPYKDLLLPEARHITIVVVDSDGSPVAEARIDHSNNRYLVQTGADGRVELDTRAPAVVVRKPGFRSVFLRIGGSNPPRIVLETVRRSFPVCSSAGAYMELSGWGASFRFSKIRGVTQGKQGRDDDYGVRFYAVKTTSGPKGIKHGSGPMWSFGIPIDQDVWRSVAYDEASYEFGKLTIIDARGKLQNGNWWRSLGKISESASYSDVDEETAHLLDRVLDSACANSAPR